MNLQFKGSDGQKADELGWMIAKAFVLLVLVATMIAASNRAVPGQQESSAARTILPAQIRAHRIESLAAAYAGRVREVSVKAGAQVQKGQLVLALESPELEHEIEAAARRIAILEGRLHHGTSAATQDYVQEQKRMADRAVEMARDRLKRYSLAALEEAYQKAVSRRKAVEELAARQFATAPEVEMAQREESNEKRNLEAGREQQARLKQELEASLSQQKLTDMQMASLSGNAGDDGVQLDLEEAQAALERLQAIRNTLTITAPFDGVVLGDLPVIGAPVTSGQTVAQVADLTQLEIEAAVGPAVARDLAPGRQLLVRLPTDPPRSFFAKTSSVQLAPSASSGPYLVKVTMPNPEPATILVGMQAGLEVEHQEIRWLPRF